MEIQKTFIFALKSTHPAIAAICSFISQPISMKFGTVNLFGAEGVLVEPEFENVDWLPWKMGNADFEAQFDQERVGLYHRFPSK